MKPIICFFILCLMFSCSQEAESGPMAALKNIESEWESVGKKLFDLSNNIQYERQQFTELANVQGMAVPEEIRSQLSEQEITKMDSLYHELSSYGRVLRRLGNQSITMTSAWEDKSKILGEVQQDVASNKVVNQTEDRIKGLEELLNRNKERIQKMNEMLSSAKGGYREISEELNKELARFSN